MNVTQTAGNAPTIVGLDIGYGFTKMSDGVRTVVFPSVVGDVVQADFDNELVNAGQGKVLTIDGARWFYGWHAQKHSRNPLALFARERTEQVDLMHVLLYAALAELDVRGAVAICTGLPVDWFADKDKTEHLLLGEHAFAVDDVPRRVSVIQTTVVPQPFGSFFDAILDEAGALVNVGLARGKVGILDVGTHTTDYALSDGLEYVAKASGSTTAAMSTAWRQIRDGIKAQWGIEYDLHQVDRLLRDGGMVTVRGEPHSINLLASAAVDSLAARVLAGARERWGTARDFARILLTGGGASYVKDQVQAVYPHVQILHAPNLGNLRGFYKYALRKFGRA